MSNIARATGIRLVCSYPPPKDNSVYLLGLTSRKMLCQ